MILPTSLRSLRRHTKPAESHDLCHHLTRYGRMQQNFTTILLRLGAISTIHIGWVCSLSSGWRERKEGVASRSMTLWTRVNPTALQSRSRLCQTNGCTQKSACSKLRALQLDLGLCPSL